jgi:hypothetical protein
MLAVVPVQQARAFLTVRGLIRAFAATAFEALKADDRAVGELD